MDRSDNFGLICHRRKRLFQVLVGVGFLKFDAINLDRDGLVHAGIHALGLPNVKLGQTALYGHCVPASALAVVLVF